MKCALYCRVSTEEQAVEGHSIEAQRQELLRYCSLYEFEVFDCYTDAGFSAATMERPALQRLLVNAGRYQMVLVCRLDRISRDMGDLMKILEVFSCRQVAFKSITENFDTSTASGKLMLNMLGSFAEFERASISERIRMAHRKILREGRWRGGEAPYGYRLTPDKTLQIREQEAETVRRIFALSAGENLGTRTIAIRLNDEGFTTRSGGLYTSSYIAKILTNPVYCGDMVYGRQKNVYREGKRRVLYNREFEIFPGRHPPLVSREIFIQSRENMQQRKENRGASGAVGNPWGGLVFCGECKAPMLRNVRKTGERFLVCGTYKHTGGCSHQYLSESRLMKETVKALELLVVQPSMSSLLEQKLEKEREQRDSSVAGRIRVLEQQAAACRDREERLVELLERQVISEEDYGKRREKIQQRKEKLSLCIRDAKAGLLALQREESQVVFTPQAVTISEMFAGASADMQKRVLHLLLERIEVLKGSRPYERKEIRFYFKI